MIGRMGADRSSRIDGIPRESRAVAIKRPSAQASTRPPRLTAARIARSPNVRAPYLSEPFLMRPMVYQSAKVHLGKIAVRAIMSAPERRRG